MEHNKCNLSSGLGVDLQLQSLKVFLSPAKNMTGAYRGQTNWEGRSEAIAWPVWVCPVDVCKCYSYKGQQSYGDFFSWHYS